MRPQFDRIDRLNVEVPVDHNRRLARRMKPVAVNDRMAARRQHIYILHTGRGQTLRNPMTGAGHIRRALR